MEFKSITIERVVQEQNTAKMMKSGSLEVLATPQMISWMEEASCLCLEGQMDEGVTSVGTCINVSHDKASAVGSTIHITSEISKIDGRKVCFQVIACEGEEIIGKGYHERFLVNEQKFLEKLK
ncbi:thioesterase family protein [Floccifex sp.]|uniref:thioesterase family protein n=1 Tax=Floccifex sp. TaxID=2815810 RepID=UPI002A75B53C|nr:thioesterase family protein [Floccifex sp.]MDD7281874.1 thioesterase family protein [Erysipelotrichaceae bacterium]MDY2958117.1 thioesterase family protein [Floccifex sp.]